MIDRIDETIEMSDLPTWLQELWGLDHSLARRAEKHYLDLKSESQKSATPRVSESKSFDIHNCINEVCDAVHARFHLYSQTARGDGSFRWRVKQAIDKMLYSH